MKSRSKVLKNNSFDWNGVERKDYKTGTTNFKDIHRYALLGEGEDEFELNMQTRYFEIKPGGYSSLEMHRHPHSVIVIRGRGSLILGNETYELALHDVVYISPETIHQFLADQNDYLGFICIVDRYRDKPEIPSSEMIERLILNPSTKAKIRR